MIKLEALPNQLPNEHVVIFLRRHWVDLLRIFLFTGLLTVVPTILIGLLTASGASLFEHPLLAPVGWLFMSAYLFIVFVITITELTDYWLDTWIVSTERIINTEQHGLFKRVVSEVYLDQIQDITSETKGFLETFLTYGDVYIQTAATKERFQFKNIDNPDTVKVQISGLAKTCKLEHTHSHSYPATDEGKL